MTTRIRTAVILAAGQGTRLGKLGHLVPKALLPVMNEPLLVGHLRRLARAGIGDVHLVIGYLGDMIREAVAQNPVAGLTVHFHVQAERHGLAHAVAQVEAAVRAPFVLMLGDIAFDAAGFERMLVLEPGTGAKLAVKVETDLAAIRMNYTVETDPGGWVRRVVEKPQHPVNNFKGTGQYTFGPRIFDAIRRTPRSALRNEYELTDAIQILIDMGEPTRSEAVIEWDLNLTHAADLLACNLHYMRQAPDRPALQSQPPPGSVIRNSVIGRNVRMPDPIRLRNCVVLDGAELVGLRQLDNAVVSGREVIRCREGLGG